MGKTKKKDKIKKQRKFKSTPAQKKAAFHSGNASTNPNRPLPDNHKAGFYRSKSTINRLNLYRTKVDIKKRREQPLQPVRIHPDRKWFGNTRVITQEKLNEFRDNISQSINDPFSVLIKKSQVPLSLFSEKNQKKSKINILQIESFEETFGAKKIRKKPKVAAQDFNQFLHLAEEGQNKYDETTDKSILKEDTDGIKDLVTEEIFKKGTSKRIWGELYKVIDSSDVIVQVIDSRDPMGTRCRKLERHIKEDRPHKHIVLLLNKCDLIPTFIAAKWVKILSKEFPTIAFHASINKPFGKNALFNLLRQFNNLLKDRKHVSVGFVGYPNVGKSSVINTLRRKKVCNAAPIPGETKVWKYINLTNRIYLIDCPGVVPADDFDAEEYTSSAAAKLLKGAIRAERVEDPEIYIDEIIKRVKPEYLVKVYNIPHDWTDGISFLTKLAFRMGKLLKGGEPDICTAARIVLYDWQRGRLPYYIVPQNFFSSSSSNQEKHENIEKNDKDNENENKIMEENQSMKDHVCTLQFDDEKELKKENIETIQSNNFIDK